MAYKRVLVIGFDGVGAFIKDANTPNFDRIFAGGNITYNGRTVFPSISAPCWGSLIYGVLPEVHDKHNATIDHVPHPVDSEIPSFFRLVREQYPDEELASFSEYKDLNVGVIEDGINVYKESYDKSLLEGLEGEERMQKYLRYVDKNVVEKLIKYYDDHDPLLTFLLIGSTDYVGHTTGYGSEAHIKQIELLDEFIGNLWDKLESQGKTEDMLVVFGTDHGGTPLSIYGSATHGGLSKNEMTITMAARGKGVIDGEMKDANIRDIAAIVLHALDVPIPEHITGIVPDNLFEGFEFKPRKEENVVFDIDKTKVVVPESDAILNYFPFKDDFYDYKGKALARPVDKYYFTKLGDGIGLDLEDGYLRLQNLKFTNESFSLAFRAKIETLDNECILFSNVDSLSKEYGTYVWWGGVIYNGFQVTMNKDGFWTLIWGDGIGDEPGQTQSHLHYNTEHTINVDLSKGKQVDFIFSVDRKKNKVEIYLDFECVASFELHENFKKYRNTLNGGMFTFGQDITGEFPAALRDVNPKAPVTIGDFFVFNKEADDEILSLLKEFYNK